MDCFEDIATGMEMANMDKTKEITQWIDGYVDDTSIFTTIPEDHYKQVEPKKLAQQLQKNTQEREILLAATGGKLELTKCFYYILCWTFDEARRCTTTPNNGRTRASRSKNIDTGDRRIRTDRNRPHGLLNRT